MDEDLWADWLIQYVQPKKARLIMINHFLFLAFVAFLYQLWLHILLFAFFTFLLILDLFIGNGFFSHQNWKQYFNFRFFFFFLEFYPYSSDISERICKYNGDRLPKRHPNIRHPSVQLSTDVLVMIIDNFR